MKKIIFFLVISTISWAQTKERKFVSHTSENGFEKIVVSDGVYYIRFLNQNCIETHFVPTGEQLDTRSHCDKEIRVDVTVSTSENNSTIIKESTNIGLRIEKLPFSITYTHNNKPFLAEKAGYFKRKHVPLELVKGNIIADSTEVLQFSISPNEALYGGGARVVGMNRRGNKLALYNRAHYGYETRAELMNFCIPLVLSSNLYAVHFDNPAVGYLDLDSQKNNTLEYETISGRKTYQVMVGVTWENLIDTYTNLTGKQPLPPRWAFGNFASRFGYRSQESAEATVRKFEETKTPVDALILDLYWFGKTIKGTMGNLDWDKETFPDPEKMIGDFKRKNVQTVLITEPFILTSSSKWNEAVANDVLVKNKEGKPCTWDFYFGNTGLVDVFKPEAREWFWSIYKKLGQQGVAGVWGDLGEPEVFPSFAQTAGGSADEVHNIYGHIWAKMIADGYKKDFPNQRPFILMRAGYSGSQKYGMIPWSGDVSRSWGGLKSQTEISLEMGMQGLGYMHSDLGGFAGDYHDNELYLRWLQYGVFNPLFRPHAQEDVASEIARKDIVTLQKAQKSVTLRYRMLPYNYTLAYENSIKGTPLMRPLLFEEPTNENLRNVSDTYLWGKNILVKPITEPGIKTTSVYFPKTANWYDFYTGKKYNAGTTATVAVAADYIPTFVRGGSFIPMYDAAMNTESSNYGKIELHYYHETGVSTESFMYEDDGKTPNANLKEAYSILHFKSSSSKVSLALTAYHNSGSQYQPVTKTITFIVHNITTKPKSVLVNGKTVNFAYDIKNKTVTVTGTQESNYVTTALLF